MLNIASNFVKPNFIEHKNRNFLKLCSFNLIDKNFGELKIESNCISSEFNDRVITQVKKQDEVLGYEMLKMSDSDSSIKGISILVNPLYKGQKIGELLRLTSIMNMIENNKDFIDIFSIDDAVYFHSKYKFEPNITNLITRNLHLSALLSNDKLPQDFLPEVCELYDLSKSQISQREQLILSKITNAFLRKFIEKILSIKNEYKKFPFSHGMEMRLSFENIVKNHEYFNKLFAEHKIDYKI